MRRTALALAILAAILARSPAYGQEPNTNAGKLVSSSANVAALTATATLAAASGLMNYVCGILVTGAGATAASVIHPTLTGLNGGTINYTMAIVAGATLTQPELKDAFYPCQPATALNTAITLSVPSFGTGNTDTTVNIWGYRLPY